MVELQIVINSNHDDQMALVRREFGEDELICSGNVYTNAINARIDGFISGLCYCGTPVNRLNDLCIEKDTDEELFSLCNFYNN